jgi:hypothetical protein
VLIKGSFRAFDDLSEAVDRCRNVLISLEGKRASMHLRRPI